MTGRPVARPIRQHVEAMREACVQVLRGQQPGTSGSQLDGQGELVQAHADLGDGTDHRLRDLERRGDGLRSLNEEGARGILRQGFPVWQMVQIGYMEGRNSVLVFAPQPQRGTAGHQEFQVRAGGKQAGKPRCGREHLLNLLSSSRRG